MILCYFYAINALLISGICITPNRCAIDYRDDDLMRMCRNIFFMTNNFISAGLLSDWPLSVEYEVKLIKKRCFEREELHSDITYIYDLLLHINNKLESKR